MDHQLQRAANEGDLDMLYHVLAKNPHAFDYFDKMKVVETPLHRAVSQGKINFAIEIMRLKPSFSKKLDARGLSPMHLALEKKQIRTVHRFLETDNGAELVRVKGKEGVTLLHYVVEQGDLKLLNEFLSVSPGSITDTTNRGETALHIAVKKGNTEALEALLAFLRRSWNDDALHLEEKVLNWKDEEGYTVLHAVAKMNQLQSTLQMMKLLLKCNVHVNAISLDGLTALDIVSEPVKTGMRKLLIQAGAVRGSSIDTISTKQLSFKSRPTLLENMIRCLKGQKTSISAESRDPLLVVAGLVATATFQAVLSPPGGLRQADSASDSLPFSKVGKVVMKEWLYMIFLILNGTSFWVTTITIFLLLPHGFYGRLLTLPLLLLSACYLFNSTVISPSLKCALVNFGLFIFFVILLLRGLVLFSNRRFFLSFRKKFGIGRK